MRISKTTSGSPAGTVKRGATSTDRSGFSSALEAPAQTAAARPTAGTVSVSSVAALMALQGAEDPLEQRKRAKRRGRQLIDALDRLKIDILDESSPKASLDQMQSLLDSAREKSDDPELESLIDQIELRIAVELAKHSRVS